MLNILCPMHDLFTSFSDNHCSPCHPPVPITVASYHIHCPSTSKLVVGLMARGEVASSIEVLERVESDSGAGGTGDENLDLLAYVEMEGED